MFLRQLTASDPRFKTIAFRDGLNLVVADRQNTATSGDSRNGTGKTSLTLLLRYLLGGNLPKQFKGEQLKDWSFLLDATLPTRPGNAGESEDVRIRRPVSPQTQVFVSGWSVLGGSGRETQLHVEEWREYLGTYLFALPEEKVPSLTPGSLWSRLIRDYFDSPTKAFPTDSDWATGLRVGHLLGLDVAALSRGGEVISLERQRKALRQAISEGALTHLNLDEAELRSELATVRRRRTERSRALEGFRVDTEYEEHQRSADELSATIVRVNDEALALTRRRRELDDAMAAEEESTADFDPSRLRQLFDEMNLVFPSQVARRYDEVSEFHRSVIRNRQTYLIDERTAVDERLQAVERERTGLDVQRSNVMRVLSTSVAFSTFAAAQQSISGLDAEAADLERRLAAAADVNGMDTRINSVSAEATGSLRAELREREQFLVERPLSMFGALGAEIYDDRTADLLLDVNKKGALAIEPRISGDASDGIRSVETFLLDTVLLVTGEHLGRCPPILVHDSHLFDSVDARQIASCLNVGARLADERGHQYVVTLNSDLLASVESEGAFDRSTYALATRLTDEREDGGLFGFRFD